MSTLGDTSYSISLACGGTGGHIFPGLATAEKLKERGHEVTLWLSGKSGEDEALRHWEGPTATIPAKGLVGNPAQKVFSVYKLYRSGRHCYRVMKHHPPDCVLAMGSYASYGPLYSGRKLGCPLILHEANVLPGKAVRLFSPWATAVAASFEETRYYMKRRNISITGMPLRKGLNPQEAELIDLGLDPRKFTILIMGGSRGAKAINESMAYAICNLSRKGTPVQVIHLTGDDDYHWVKDMYRDYHVPAWVHAFTHNMGALYLQADLTVSRAGASSCAEIRAFAVPSLLVPYPHAVHDHQTVNARAMSRSKGADMVAQKDMSIDWLEDYIRGNMEYPRRLQMMRSRLRETQQTPASENLADLVERTIRRSRIRKQEHAA